ncbi:uncharacterized protein N7473_005533 [Penicillium subrubescens]|uniref:Uncharacterized protein n=1 Tax=Penicillium subrubescens TaxID=1316194 RepID=A0A1Q5T639_9EURO|nr:uncharacterized protein N7473_005533 [Penicillium subrubescens]KAJ5896134.1 hypothetical protein N7473_005533 [Penicillium subrubescens]OKO95672.1 hypothetical protein PENSUB_11184 [Penicillium subrubescens]
MNPKARGGVTFVECVEISHASSCAVRFSQQLEEVDDDTVQRRALILSSCNRYAGQARRAVKAVSVVNAVDIIDRVSQSNPIERIFLQYLTSWFMHRCKSPPNSGERPKNGVTAFWGQILWELMRFFQTSGPV